MAAASTSVARRRRRVDEAVDMVGVERALRRRVGRHDGGVHVVDDRVVRRRGGDVPGRHRRRGGGIGRHRRARLPARTAAAPMSCGRRQRRRAPALGHVDVDRPVVAVRQERLRLGLRERGTRVVPVGRRRVEARRRAGVGAVHVHAVGAAHDHVGRVGQVEPGDLEARSGAGRTCWRWPTASPSPPGVAPARCRCRPSPCPPWRCPSTRVPRPGSWRSGRAPRPARRRRGRPPPGLRRRISPAGERQASLGRDDRRHHRRRQQDHQRSGVGVGVRAAEDVADEALARRSTTGRRAGRRRPGTSPGAAPPAGRGR